MKLKAIALLILFGLSTPSLHAGTSLQLISKWPFVSAASYLQAAPNAVAFGAHSSESEGIVIWAIGDTVQIIKASDLTSIFTFRVKTTTAVYDIHYRDEAGNETLYIAAGKGNTTLETGGIQIFDLSDLTTPPPAPVGAIFEIPGNPGSLKISETETQDLPELNALGLGYADDTIYLADNNYGLRVINVTDPAAPTEISTGYKQGDINGTYKTTGGYTNAEAITFQGKTYAFVLDFYNGMKVFDVTDPAAIAAPALKNMQTNVLYGSAALVSDVHPVTGTDGRLYAYVTAMDQYAETSVVSKLSILSDQNMLTETSILNMGRLATPGNATGVTAWDENTAYVADDHKGLQIVDVSGTPPAGEVLDFPIKGSYTTQANGTYSVVRLADGLCMGTLESGLLKLNVANPAAPTLLATTASALVGDAIYVSNSTTCLLDSTRGLRIFDSSSLSAPTLKGFLPITGTTYDITIMGPYAYIAHGTNGVTVVDLSDPSVPVVIAQTATPGTSMAVDGYSFNNRSYICVAEGASGSRLVDVTDPSHPGTPVVIDRSGFSAGTDSAITVFENRAYIADGLGFKIADLSNPATPVIMGEKATPGNAVAVCVFRQGTSVYAAIADDTDGILIVDVTDPDTIPAPVATIPLPATGRYLSLAVVDTWLFAASDTGGLVVFSLSDPIHPVKKDAFATRSRTRDVVAFTRDGVTYAAAADTNNGMFFSRIYDSGDTDIKDSLTSSSSSSGCFIGTAGAQ